MQLFNNITKAKFLSRPNRFIIMCDLNGKEVKTYLPNPGRLWELLFPGVTLYLEKSDNEERKIPWTVVAVESRGKPVMLHTHRTNDAARHLLEKGLVPGLEDTQIVRSEVKYGNSRFDFLLRRGDKDIYLEVKSCTLFSKRVAMFPDAITERGKRHVEELVHLSSGKTRCVVLFVISSPDIEVFSPEYHTDLDFALTLLKAKDKIDIIPLAIGWRDDLSLEEKVKKVSIPWEKIEREASDRGAYLFLMKLDKDMAIETGSLGKVFYRKGYYIYVGSAMKNLTQRIERHKRLRKNMHWHIDYLRQHADFHAALPIRTAKKIECQLADSLCKISHWHVPSFGSTDCHCHSHLFGINEDPLHSIPFHDFLQYHRMENLLEFP